MSKTESQAVVGVNSDKCGVPSQRRCEIMSLAACAVLLEFPASGCQRNSVVYETECRHAAAVQRVKQDQNH